MSLDSWLQPAPCDECGASPVFHRAERWSARINSVFDFVVKPLTHIEKAFASFADPLIDRYAFALARILRRLKIADIVSAPDKHTAETELMMWQEANRRGITMQEIRLFGLPRRIFAASYGGRSIVFEGLPRPARPQKSLHWIDDKSEMKNRFLKEGFPVARGGVCRTERQALRQFRLLAKPVIAKPRTGSNGRHTTVHIETEDELRAGFRNAARICPWVIIEEELQGPVFRATLIDRTLVAVLRRDPPQVLGDGKHTVRELVEEENKNPLRRGPAFAPIVCTARAAVAELTRQNLTAEAIPTLGQSISFHFKVNWGVGGTSRDATDEVHPDNRLLFETIGEYLGEDIVGIDCMISDISKSWKEQKRCGVIECNSLPQIGNHHFPFSGPIVDVASTVWDMVFPDSKRGAE